MPDIGDILARVRPREHSVTICLAGDKAAEVERLEAELGRHAGWRPDSMAATDPRREIAERIQALREEMQESEVTLTFRALGARAWSDLVAQHPSTREGEAWDPEALAPALVAASAAEPEMTPEQVAELFEALNHGQREQIIGAAWAVNGEPTSVPFSLLASATLAARGGEK
ncbi:hypothetical protein [Streptomyces harbinensis]|uniref:hypothetical protein n=1 Tax=Streptomyces harbinensis TaxID=1176198 RepID=UPI0036B524D0